MSLSSSNSKKKSWLVSIVSILIFSFIIIGYYIWNRPARDVQHEASAIHISADSLFKAYVSNEKNANQLFLDKTLTVSGKVGSVSKNADGKTIVFLQTEDPMFGINCTLEDSTATINNSEQIELKGVCTGYTSDVILIRCYLTKKVL